MIELYVGKYFQTFAQKNFLHRDLKQFSKLEVSCLSCLSPFVIWTVNR